MTFKKSNKTNGELFCGTCGGDVEVILERGLTAVEEITCKVCGRSALYVVPTFTPRPNMGDYIMLTAEQYGQFMRPWRVAPTGLRRWPRLAAQVAKARGIFLS